MPPRSVRSSLGGNLDRRSQLFFDIGPIGHSELSRLLADHRLTGARLTAPLLHNPELSCSPSLPEMLHLESGST